MEELSVTDEDKAGRSGDDTKSQLQEQRVSWTAASVSMVFRLTETVNGPAGLNGGRTGMIVDQRNNPGHIAVKESLSTLDAELLVLSFMLFTKEFFSSLVSRLQTEKVNGFSMT